jgi:hypothetical protein
MSDTRQRLVTGGAHNEQMFRLLIAARMFGVRLIDNMPLVPQLAPGQSEAPLTGGQCSSGGPGL